MKTGKGFVNVVIYWGCERKQMEHLNAASKLFTLLSQTKVQFVKRVMIEMIMNSIHQE